MWRLLTSERLRVTMSELETSWTLDDMLDAHDVLDAFDDAAALAHEAK